MPPTTRSRASLSQSGETTVESQVNDKHNSTSNTPNDGLDATSSDIVAVVEVCQTFRLPTYPAPKPPVEKRKLIIHLSLLGPHVWFNTEYESAQARTE